MDVVMPIKNLPMSVPSSPNRFAGGSRGDPFDFYCHYTSAPTSPNRVAAIYAASAVPFEWEDTPDSRESQDDGEEDDDFSFAFDGQPEKDVLPQGLTDADELFEKGRIRPMTPFVSVTMTETNGGRGRERKTSIPSCRSRKGSRSLSPMRGEHRESFLRSPVSSPQASTSAAPSSAKSRGGSRKWRLKDLLLFRSGSEGRATGHRSKDPLRKYSILSITNSLSGNKKKGEESKDSGFRPGADGSVGSSRAKGGMSPHEMHYTSNRAASEEMRKKTPLPFVRQGLFGGLRYNSSAFNRRQ